MIESNEEYVASCDLNSEISCSKVLTSDYGHILSALNIVPVNSIFDRPNCEYGILFYLSIFLFYSYSKISSIMKYFLVFAAIFGILFSFILAYLMIYIIKYICLVCIGTYIANFAIFIITCSYLLDPSIKSHNN